MNTLKILLVIPYEDVARELHVRRKVIYPIEPAIVVSILQQHDMMVEGIDLNLLSCDDNNVLAYLYRKVVHYEPHIVVIMSQDLAFLIKDQHEVIKSILLTLQQTQQNHAVILAGTTPSIYPKQFFNIPGEPDVVFRGEIEDKILTIIRHLDKPDILKTVAGVCVREHQNLFIAEETSYVENLNSLPIADREVFPVEDYFAHPEIKNLRYPEKSRKFTQIAATRGCNTNCTFCKVKHLRGKYRWRNIEHIMDEIKYLVYEKGIEEIHFLDENLLLNKVRAKQLFKKIREEQIKFFWFCGGGMAVYTLDKELLNLLKATGCYRLHLAIESGSQRILSDVMKKPVKLQNVSDILEYAHRLDFEIIGYFMIGLPTETKEEVLKTVAFAKNPLFDYVVFSIYTPEKGTQLYDYCFEHDLFTDHEEVQILSKRAESNLLFPDYDNTFLTHIRTHVWKTINFSTPARKQKITKMFGEAIS